MGKVSESGLQVQPKIWPYDVLLVRNCCVCWEIQHIFLTQILWVRTNSYQFLRDGRIDLLQVLGEHTSLIDTSVVYLTCQVRYLVSELHC